ncbi:hypothetical protein As57867_017936, partial [Aphanomyces stellatus]
MSVRDIPQAFPSSTPTVKAATVYLYDLVVYITCLLGLVGGLCLVATVAVKFHIHAANLIWFNRVVGSLWIGRPLLCIRGIIAVLLLGTSPLQPVLTTPSSTRFQIQPRHWLETLIVAGEATWVLYIAQDFLTLVAHKLATLYGPVSCVIAWAALAALEMAAPVTPTSTLSRTSSAQDMDAVIECASGTVYIGSATRVALIVGIQALSLVVFYVAVWLYHGRTMESTEFLSSNRHVLGTADIFLEDSNESTKRLWSMGKVSCLMAGLVTFSWRGHHYIFNVKLWTVQTDTASTRSAFSTFENHDAMLASAKYVISAANGVAASQPYTLLAHPHVKRLLVGGGFCCLVVAIVSSISYVQVSQQQLANDLFWGAFNMTGAHAFLANWYNQQLILGNSNVTIQINKQDINQEGMFNLAKATVTTSENFGSLMQNTDLNTIDAIVKGLRTTDACLVPWIFTQYCYVDFNRQWEMASTAARQQRCRAMTANGAVFLESSLRNVNYQAFRECWGAAFDVAVAAEVGRTQGGQTWLTLVSSPVKLPIADEVAAWSGHGIKHFTPQWQNFKTVGLNNYYDVKNVFGSTYPFTLQYKLGNFRLDKQTTYKMYWGLANDWIAVAQNSSGIGGLSLVRSSPTYAFTNQTAETVMLQNGTL